MNAKHTPGPWFHALQAGAETQHFIYGPHGKPRIAEVLGNSTEQITANARLIAAAPELLAALQAVLAMDVKGHSLLDRLQFSPEGRALSEQCLGAIAKAKGEA